MTPDVRKMMDRRAFIRSVAAGTAIVALGGGLYYLAEDDLTRKARADGASWE